MKKVILFLLIFGSIVVAAPEDDMNLIIDAVYRSDSETVYRGLSIENREALSGVISMMRIAPGQVAQQIREELEVQISTADIVSIDGAGLVRVIIDSPFFKRELPSSRDMIICENHVMQGDTAVVYVSIAESDSLFGYPMLLQEGSWKISESFF